jgi:O-antigen/teichoic acid export membrane protein
MMKLDRDTIANFSAKLFGNSYSGHFTTFLSDSSSRRLISGTRWRVTATLGGQLARLITAVVLARLLGRSVFGEFGLLQNTVGLLGSVASLSLGNTVLKHVAEYRETEPSRAGRLIGFGLVTIGSSAALVGLLLCVFAEEISNRGLKAGGLVVCLRLLSVDIVFNAVESVQTGALLGLEAFRTTAVNSNGKSVLYLLCSIAGALINGLEGAIIGQLITDFVFTMVNANTLRRHCAVREIRIRYQVHRSDWRTVRSFSLPMFLTSSLNWFAQWFSNAALGRRLGGFSDLAVFQVGRQWATVITLVPGAMGEAGLPILANHFGSGRRADFTKSVAHQYSLVLRISTATAAGIAALSPAILAAYGHAFEGNYPPLLLLSACGVCQALICIPQQVVSSTGLMWPGFIFTLGFASVLMSCSLALSSHGALGLSSAYLLAYGVDLAMLATFAGSVLKRMRRHCSAPQHEASQ